jgi:hypothetical protein
MTRYYFDFSTRGQLLYDYRGDEFRTHQAACQYAQAIALHLKHSLDDEWASWFVEVRDPAGRKLLSIPVASAELIAA